MTSTPKVWIGIAAIFVVLVVVVRFGLRSGQPPTEPQPSARDAMQQSDRVRQRLEELRATRPGVPRADMGAREEKGGRIQAREGITARPLRNMPSAPGGRATGQASKAEANPPAGNAPDTAPFDEDPEDIPTLKVLALQDPDPDRRLTAVTMLGATEDPQAIPILAQALSDSDEEVRMAALEGLSDFTDEPPVEAIENAINDPSADIRFEAVSVLSDIGGDRARRAIEKALNDEDEDVRTLAEGILDMEETYEGTPDAGAGPAPPQPGMQPQAAAPQ
jgi:hypothetical protein